MTSNETIHVQEVRYLTRPGGRVAYEVSGAGPLVVLVPGMGDLRGTYRFLVPSIVDAGFRVAWTDLRWHGDNDATFASYGDVDTAGDVVALVESLGGPAAVVGNSIAPAPRCSPPPSGPARSGLVLVGPFVRDGKGGPRQRMLLRLLLAQAVGRGLLEGLPAKLYAGHRHLDFDQHRSEIVASLHKPGHAKAFSTTRTLSTTRTSHRQAESRLGEVAKPVLVVMGEQDPDFPDPKAEAQRIAGALHPRVVMVADAGHYPQAQQPAAVTRPVLEFLPNTDKAQRLEGVFG